MHERIKKMCNDYRCIRGSTTSQESENKLALQHLRETIAELHEDWVSTPLTANYKEKKLRLYKKLKHLQQKERQLLDQS